MPKSLMLIFIVNFSIACNHSIYKNSSPSSITDIDSTINKVIILKDPYSVIKYLGDIDSLVNESDTAAPDIYFYNISKTEYLRMKKWYGDGANVFRSFEIGETKILPKNIQILNSDFIRFNTESSVKIGMKKEDFLRIKKRMTFLENQSNGLNVLSFSDGELYYSVYYFKNDLLIKFEFGYLYP